MDLEISHARRILGSIKQTRQGRIIADGKMIVRQELGLADAVNALAKKDAGDTGRAFIRRQLVEAGFLAGRGAGPRTIDLDRINYELSAKFIDHRDGSKFAFVGRLGIPEEVLALNKRIGLPLADLPLIKSPAMGQEEFVASLVNSPSLGLRMLGIEMVFRRSDDIQRAAILAELNGLEKASLAKLLITEE